MKLFNFINAAKLKAVKPEPIYKIFHVSLSEFYTFCKTVKIPIVLNSFIPGTLLQ